MARLQINTTTISFEKYFVDLNGGLFNKWAVFQLYSWQAQVYKVPLWVRTPLRRSVLNTTLCDKVCQWLTTGWWFSPVSSTNKTERNNLTDILLKVALNTIDLTLTQKITSFTWAKGDNQLILTHWLYLNIDAALIYTSCFTWTENILQSHNSWSL